MLKRPRTHQRRIACILLLGLTAGLSAPLKAEENNGLQNSLGNNLQDYLSDPRRVGSLSGSIIGGALTAHPVGPVIGSLIGFMIGKRSTESERPAPESYRASPAHPSSIMVPMSEGNVATLSISGQQPTTQIHAPPAQPVATLDSRQLVAPPLVPLATNQAALCADGGRARGNPLCYYGLR